jgi:hypothetical protein
MISFQFDRREINSNYSFKKLICHFVFKAVTQDDSFLILRRLIMIQQFKKLSFPSQICIASCIIIPFCLTIALLIAKPNSQDFVDARSIAPSSLIKKAIADNYFSMNTTLSPKSLKIEGENPIYIFDFNTPDLCGLSGCLYVGYVPDGSKALSLYLKDLPKNVKLFAADGAQNHYPCIAISQPYQATHQGNLPLKISLAENRIVKNRYCYQGGKMVSVFQQLVEGG